MKKTASNSKQIAIYDYEKRIGRTLALIEKELPEKTVHLIYRYNNAMISESMAHATRHKHLQTLLNLSRLLEKEWTEATADNIQSLVSKIVMKYSDNGKETNTTHDHKKVLKIFFRWLKLGSRNKNEVGDPTETKCVRLKPVQDKIVREDLVTESDRDRIIQACGGNARDIAFIDCHMEAGTRPGEILNLRIKHVKFDKFGAVLHVDGKTGARPIRLVRSAPRLASWLAVHPFKDNPEEPLWIMLSKIKFGRPLTYPAARQMLQRRCEIANIPKRIHLNLFRHSEATETAKYMSEAQMKKRHGWANNSKMPARYVHLVSADVEDAIFKHYGISKKEEEMPKIPRRCIYCDVSNPHDTGNCSKCGRPLDLATAVKTEAEFERQIEQKILGALEKNLPYMINQASERIKQQFMKEGWVKADQ